jgi:small subunit ribosomal protein S20
MPVTKSAQKALKQQAKKRKNNLGYKKQMKELKKQILSKRGENKTKQAQEILPKYYKAVDKAAKVGIIKKNTAGRKKARMAKMIKS